MEKTATYEVLEGEALNRNDQDFAGGDTLELTEKEAQPLLRAKVIKKVDPPPTPKASAKKGEKSPTEGDPKAGADGNPQEPK